MEADSDGDRQEAVSQSLKAPGADSFNGLAMTENGENANVLRNHRRPQLRILDGH